MVRTATSSRWILSLAGILMLPVAAAAQIDAVAPQLSFGDKADLGVGVRFMFGTQGWHPDSEIQVGLDLFFPDEPPGTDLGYFEVNANLVRSFRLGGNSTLLPYAGAGFNIARLSASSDGVSFSERSDTELGVNILGGLRFNLARYDPFVEVRFELGGGEQGVLTGGLRIPT